MLKINGIEPLNSISLNESTHTRMDSNNMEQVVENWLNQNKDWFKLYAIENLDLNTVEKWLRSNNKKICKCVNNAKFGDVADTSLGYNLFNKRNSLCGSGVTKTELAHIAKMDPKKEAPLNASLDANTSGATFLTCLNAKKVKFFNKDGAKEELPAPASTPIKPCLNNTNNHRIQNHQNQAWVMQKISISINFCKNSII